MESVFDSFGAAPCRESVFVREYEPRVAVYLRDRGSKALSVTLVEDEFRDHKSLLVKKVLLVTFLFQLPFMSRFTPVVHVSATKNNN